MRLRQWLHSLLIATLLWGLLRSLNLLLHIEEALDELLVDFDADLGG